MSDRVNNTLDQLSTAFTVRDIMTRYDDLRLVDDEAEAKRFFEEQEDYDYTAAPERDLTDATKRPSAPSQAA